MKSVPTLKLHTPVLDPLPKGQTPLKGAAALWKTLGRELQTYRNHSNTHPPDHIQLSVHASNCVQLSVVIQGFVICDFPVEIITSTRFLGFRISDPEFQSHHHREAQNHLDAAILA